MSIPLRILRKQSQERHPRPALSGREMDREAMILNNAKNIFTEFPWNAVSFAALADICRIAPATLKKHFPDTESVMDRLITDHLMAVARAIGTIRWDAPDFHRCRRQAYLQATREPLGGHTPIHLMMLQYLPSLPDDVRLPLQQIRAGIAESITGPEGVHPEAVLALVDIVYLNADEIEASIAAIATQRQSAQPSTQPEAPEPPAAKIRSDHIRLLQPPEPLNPGEDLPTPRAGSLPQAALLHKSG